MLPNIVLAATLKDITEAFFVTIFFSEFINQFVCVFMNFRLWIASRFVNKPRSNINQICFVNVSFIKKISYFIAKMTIPNSGFIERKGYFYHRLVVRKTLVFMAGGFYLILRVRNSNNKRYFSALALSGEPGSDFI